MNFASDNRGPAHPKIIEAIMRTNTGYCPSYGGDDGTDRACQMVREIFENDDAEVFLTATGTATNALILATLTQPWDEIYTSFTSHIRQDECNAIEFYTGGARITHVGTGDILDAEMLAQQLAGAAPLGIHNAQPGAVSFSQLSDRGHTYTLDEIGAISRAAKTREIPVHMDGARFANALAVLGCTPAEMTWKSGVDAVSFGGTKNGCVGVEAAIFFNKGHAREFELRRKRAGHLFSKGRFLSAQMESYLDGGHWLQTARAANEAGQKLFKGLASLPDVTFEAPAKGNLAFMWLPRAMHARVMNAGAVYEIHGDPFSGPPDEQIMGRFVCDWSTDLGEIDRFLEIAAG